MPRLTPCRSCHSHVLPEEHVCPHCGASLRGNVLDKAAIPAVLVGLALAGCPSEPDYGVPDTGETTSTATAGTETGTGTGTETGTPDTGEPEYGVPTT